MRQLWLQSVSALLFATAPLLSYAASQPKITSTEFDKLPSSFFYFDDSPVILALQSFKDTEKVVWRSDDDGATWETVKDAPKDLVWDIFDHPFEKQTAYILTQGKEHYVTKDRGKHWDKFKTKYPPTWDTSPLVFNAKKPEYVLYTGMECTDNGLFCKDHTFYTTDGFDTDPKLLREETFGCTFARGTKTFDKAHAETTLCIVNGEDSDARNKRRLLISSDWFEGSFEPELDGTRNIRGVTVVAAVHKFILAAVKSPGTDEMALYVTQDTNNWDRAEFPQDHGGLKENAYTLLESTPYSVQVDVLSGSQQSPVGSLFMSNSNGTYFTRSIDGTNRAKTGLVDFEQVSGIEGIVLVNVVKNLEEVRRRPLADKEIESKISFDGGRTWSDIKTKDGKKLNVHSVTGLNNAGRVFSSPAPGLLMAVGNTGDSLKAYDRGDLYVSDNAGLTWEYALEDAHKYEFGDQGSILVAVYDEGWVDTLQFSMDHGKTWKKAELPKKIKARALTTTKDSTSKKFVLAGEGKDGDGKAYIMSIDFEALNERKCKLDKDDEKKSDFEKWYARLDEEGKPDCLMGHKQFYWRRKKDAECFVDDVYTDPVPVEENCPCTEEDFECDYNFARENNDPKAECKLVGKLIIPPAACTKPGDVFMASSGYRVIPGNTCDREAGVKKDKGTERPCTDAVKNPASGKIKDLRKDFSTSKADEYYYLERAESSNGDDETVILRTNEHEVWVTSDQGGKWQRVLEHSDVIAIYPHLYFNDIVYFVTPGLEVFYTADRGATYSSFKAPTLPNKSGVQILNFHPNRKDWLIWSGSKDCDRNQFSSSCRVVSYYSTNRGDEWHQLAGYVRNCQWIRNANSGESIPEKLVYCEKYEKEEKPGPSNPLQLVSSENWFEDEKTLFKDIIGFAAMEEFIIVAAINKDGKTLQLDASIDGKTFAEAKFPHNFEIQHQQAYTVLDSVTHAVFLHVTVNPTRGSEFGTILKSNSNGTSYVKSLDGVNRNEAGYVDFEKMQGLEGVALVNVVDNIKEAMAGSKKKLKSMITHNDGGSWSYLPAPAKNSEGKAYSCNVKDKNKCSLHLHAYTERKDYRDTYSSGSAVGLMVAVGNVGEYLTSKADSNTYLTRDGGITWKEVKKGPYMWEYGDQGSIIVLVEENNPTNKIYYTLDEGETWEEHVFDDDKIHIEDITTVPSDTSRKFILWGKPERGAKITTISIDFSGLTDKICVLKEKKDDGDFELWSPQHPSQASGCLFGHKSEYYRKIPEHRCYIGKKIPQPHKILKNCECAREDYECDYNYEHQNDGTCALVPGLSPPDHSTFCEANKDAVEFFPPTGYRRVPLTTCEGGKEFDKSQPKPCKGKEKEFNEKHGASSVGIFFAALTPVVVSMGVGWWVYNNWHNKFGTIRLGDDSGSPTDKPWVRYPIVVMSALVAMTMAIPGIVMALASWAGSKLQRQRRFTTRSSFSRRGYSAVHSDDLDDGGLLAGDEDDDDEEV